jgi:hypothetical protein
VPRYQLFVDDSGTREYDDNRDYESSGKSLYFVYGAILIQQDAAARLIEQLKQLKTLAFRRSTVEIKSNWLRIPKERRVRYLEPFGLSEAAVTRFTDDYYRLLVQAPLTLLGSVVNKLHMQERYELPWYAPTAAYEFLMQRAVQAVPAGFTLGVTIDDISGKTPKNNKYKDLVARHHDTLRARGSSLQPKISFACLDSPARFVLSQHNELIQAADLVSYCIHRQFKDHGEDWERAPQGGGQLPLYPYFERIAGKFRTDEQKRVQGFGIVKAPLLSRIRWKVEDDEEGTEAAP